MRYKLSSKITSSMVNQNTSRGKGYFSVSPLSHVSCMISRSSRQLAKGFALPVVLCFGLVLFFFAFMLINANLGTKKQKLATVHYTQALLMCQAAIQHFKLKYRLIPDAPFQAGFLAYGINPFYEINKENKVLEDFSQGHKPPFPQFLGIFVEDITTREKTEPGMWKYLTMGGVEVETKGGLKGIPLDRGGFDGTKYLSWGMDFTQWGYDLIRVNSSSVRFEYDTKRGQYFQEQAITFEVEGRAHSTMGRVRPERGGSLEENPVRKVEVKETFKMTRWFDTF